MTHLTPEAQVRLDIDRQLTAAGWTVQSRDQMDIFNHRAVVVREFALTGGFADYLLIVVKEAIGVVEVSGRLKANSSCKIQQMSRCRCC